MNDLRELIYAVAQSTAVAQLLTKPLPANAPHSITFHICPLFTSHKDGVKHGRAHNNFIQIFEFR